MKIDIYQVDAFSRHLFRGNPAAVCPLPRWLPKSLMQQIAAENNLSETVFFVKNAYLYEIKWFTPKTEVDLCGHATLAAAHVLFEHLKETSPELIFNSNSGQLKVSRGEKMLYLDFPAASFEPVVEEPEGLREALGASPSQLYRATDLMAVFESEEQVAALNPDFGLLKKIPTRGLIVTAPGKETDFVSRFFAPLCGIDEDPVTGSAHTVLIPYWAGKTGKTEFFAKQISERGGELFCKLKGERVEIGGEACTYLQGSIEIPGTY